MDRGERRRRDENYVRWLKKRWLESFRWSKYPWFGHGLGSRKRRLQMHACSKKTKGRPKAGHGCKFGHGASPKWARYRERNRWIKYGWDSCGSCGG